jgi:hypothetical protein
MLALESPQAAGRCKLLHFGGWSGGHACNDVHVLTMGFDSGGGDSDADVAAQGCAATLPRLNIAANVVVVKGVGTRPRYGHISALTSDATKLCVLGGHSDIDFCSTSAELDLQRGVWAESDMSESFAPRACTIAAAAFSLRVAVTASHAAGAASCVIDRDRGIMIAHGGRTRGGRLLDDTFLWDCRARAIQRFIAPPSTARYIKSNVQLCRVLSERAQRCSSSLPGARLGSVMLHKV